MSRMRRSSRPYGSAWLAATAVLGLAETGGAQVEPAPQIRFDTSRFRPSPEEAVEIRSLIAGLVTIEAPGDSSAVNWFPRSPERWMVEFVALDREASGQHAGARLVEFGPKAIPALLEALDDAAPAKLIVGAPQVEATLIGTGHEIQGLPHAATRGDLCYAILGQITNRDYRVLRYESVGLMEQVVRSPTADQKTVAEIRATWSSEDPARKLFDSLMLDFRTRGDGSQGLQCGAAVRLFHYFPDQATDLIVARLDGLDVAQIRPRTSAVTEAWTRRQKSNGVDASELIRAVGSVSSPEADRAILRILERCDDPLISHECITASTVELAPELVFRRIGEIINGMPAAQEEPYAREIFALHKAVKYFPQRARPLLERYAAGGAPVRVMASLSSLSRPQQPISWAVEYLASFLDNQVETNHRYGPDYDLRPTRLCDWAAQTLVDYLPGATFKLEGTHEDLDRQIALLKRWIAGDRSISFDDVRPLPPYPAEVAESWPEVVMDFDASLGQVYDFSNQRTIYVGHGVRGEHGWGWEIVWIDVATASVVMRAPLGEGVGGSGIVGPVHGGSMFTMMNCGDPGRIVETDIRTGVVLGAVETPFRRGGSDRPLVVRGFGDTAISSDNRWLVALTSDGALHSVDLVTGAYTKEWQPLDDAIGPEMPHCGSLTPVQGTNRFLITDLAKPTHMWDQDARQIAILERIPHRDWRAAWGPIALNGADSGAILWNIQTRRRIELPLPEDKVEDATPNGDQSVLFAMMAGGDIEVVDLDLGCVIARLRLPPRFLQSSMTLSGDGRTLVWLTNGREPDEEVGRSRIAVFDVTDFTR